MNRRHTRRRERARHARRSWLFGFPILGFLLFGIVAFAAAVMLPTASLLGASPATMVSAPATLGPETISNAGGLLVLAIVASALGALLAAYGSMRPSRR
jgi:hypothetical protein